MSACPGAGQVRSDGSDLNWVALKYDGKTKLAVGGKGAGGFAEFKAYLPDDQCTWAFLRMMAGDQESKRPKFVLVQYNGPSTPAMAKSRAGPHKPDIENFVGQHHVFFFTDDPEDMSVCACAAVLIPTQICTHKIII